MLNQELEITVDKVAQSKAKPAPNKLGFGQHFTDHMFVMCWNKAAGWHDARIQAYQPFHLMPASMVFHYGQAIFEGMKAYRTPQDQLALFRPQENMRRLNQSARRLCMPPIPEEAVLKALKALIYLDRDWVPSAEGASLYIRPTMIATEAMLGLRPAQEYMFFIICCPVGAYYPEGFNPTKIYVEDVYVRAAPGGVGNVKTAGNYAASVKAQLEAQQKGYTQVLWLDGAERRFIEEVGASNIFFVIDGELITPPLEGTILPGITRDSVLSLAKAWGLRASERRLSIDEVVEAHEKGTLQECFGAGTAAVISPVGELYYKGMQIIINNNQAGPLAQRFYQELLAIQFGRKQGPAGWIVTVA